MCHQNYQRKEYLKAHLRLYRSKQKSEVVLQQMRSFVSFTKKDRSANPWWTLRIELIGGKKSKKYSTERKKCK